MLRIGTDCSGIEAPIEALNQLRSENALAGLVGIPYHHVFSSEIDKYCIQSIKTNYKPDIIFGDKDGKYPDGDITRRNIEDVPDIDLYVCGFPCQPFSIAGKRKGFEDKRGNVFWACIEVIKVKKPKYFILENVLGLLSHNKGNTFKVIMDELNGLEDYVVDWKKLNTRDYGIPQNRRRIYMVGIRKDLNKTIEWPKETNMDKLENYIDHSDDKIVDLKRKYASKMFNKLPENSLFVDMNFSHAKFFPNSHIHSPCLNTFNGLWCIPKNRYANIKERLKLQGFSCGFKQVVSKTQLVKQTGNSMSVNVVKAILKRLVFQS